MGVPTMTDADRLLRVVLDQPDEDTPRLELADALSETGRPAAVARAELIRVQVELARKVPEPAQSQIRRGGIQEHLDLIPESTWGEWPAPIDLMRREQALLKKWGARWLPATGRKAAHYLCEVAGDAVTATAFGPGSYRYRFARGFVSEVTITALATVRESQLNSRWFGEFVREVLSAHPLERAVFVWEGHEPEVTVRICRSYGATWYATIDSDDSRALATADYKPRSELLKMLPRFMWCQFSEVAFLPRAVPVPF